MPYICMCFGWFQELRREARVYDLAAAETELLSMLEAGGMIVHVYRDGDLDRPELVGRHSRLRSFITAGSGKEPSSATTLPHEIERFLLDSASLDAWKAASETGMLLEERWAVVDFYAVGRPEAASLYGRAVLC